TLLETDYDGPSPIQTPPSPAPTAENLLGLDYRALAALFQRFRRPIIDAHTHINGAHAARVYAEARAIFGVSLTYSMTQLRQVDAVRAALGDSVRFIAVPDFMNPDRAHAHTQGYLDALTQWAALGARSCKFWVAPRGRDFAKQAGDPDLLSLTNPWRRRQMDHAAALGMSFMCHVADPDTWFQTKYADASIYGTKAQQYEPLEVLLRDYRSIPWLLAHMGGWPEDLDFLEGLLDRNPNVLLDTSATKWMVRELSKHPRPRFLGFLSRWRGRILFGSDIVTSDAHLGLEHSGGPPPMHEVRTPEGAFDLYASRYWALRTLLETDYDGPSPIADPDLMLVEPDRHHALSAPTLRGHSLPRDLLEDIYFANAERVLGARYGG
ncbi:MAG: hypothetical protein CVV40_00600, partial [Planctomycetes bacterium HGW-Planctomycetes-2]